MFRCPYPNCSAVFEPASQTEPPLLCPQCHRPSARCPGLLSQGTRCEALNRPLARFCRFCRERLPDGWFEQALASHRLISPDGPVLPLQLERNADREHVLEPVLCLSDHFAGAETAVELRAVAGRVWVGTSAGRFLIVEPFARQASPLTQRRPWSVTTPVHPRACAGGVWLLMWCQLGIQACDMLPLDARGPAFGVLPVWEAGPRQRLLGEPVLLRLPPDPEQPASEFDRVVLWLSDGSEGVSLNASLLSLNAEQLPARKQWLLGDRVAIDPSDIGLVPAPVSQRDRAILRAGPRLYWVRFKAGEEDDPLGGANLEPIPTPSSDPPRLLCGTGRADLPGMFFVPSATPEEPGEGPRVLGQLFVTARRSNEPERRELFALDCYDGSQRGAFVPVGEGIPLATSGPEAATASFVCVTRDGLRRYNEMGQETLRYDDPVLRSTQRGQSSCRVVVCSGTDTSTDRLRTFVTLVDLATEQLIDSLPSNERLPHPVLIGRYLITVERLPRADPSRGPGAAESETALFLARRRIVARAPGGRQG